MRIQFSSLAVVFVVAITIGSVKCGPKMDLNGLLKMMQPVSKSCSTKTGLADDVLAAARSGQFAKDPKLMCFFKCLAIALKIINKEGRFSLDSMQLQANAMLEPDLAKRIIDISKQCHDTVAHKEDTCEYAYDLVICSHAKDPELFTL